MNSIEKIIKFLLNLIMIILVLLVIILGYNFVQVNFLEKSYANFFGYAFFQVTSGSMKDAINIDSIIAVKIDDEINEGDIITFKQKNDIITHRIIKINGDSITTKGDANNTEDKPITKEDVIGKVIHIFPNAGIWIKVFSDFKVIISIIITLLFLGLAVSNKKQEESKRKRHSFAKFIKNARGMIKNEQKKEKKET